MTHQLLLSESTQTLREVNQQENRQRMENGQLYFAFTPDLVADRKRCRLAFEKFNNAGDVSRRVMVQMFADIIKDDTPLPPQAPTPEEDEDLFADRVWCDGPVKFDYGYNVKYVLVNSGSTWIDTCTITVGARTLIGPNCSFLSGTHPTDPRCRNGTSGPETGKPVVIGEDCWLGANVIVLPGVIIGRGCTIGAGSVVTKSIPPLMVAVGNPARVLRRVTEVPEEELPPGYVPPRDIPISEADLYDNL